MSTGSVRQGLHLPHVIGKNKNKINTLLFLSRITTTTIGKGGPCDRVESCTGTSALCPANSFAGNDTICRPSVSPVTTHNDRCRLILLSYVSLSQCDYAERCDGSSAECPLDRKAPFGIPFILSLSLSQFVFWGDN